MKKKTVWIALAVCLAAVAGMVVSIALTGGEAEQPEFVPPAFEASAMAGAPDVTDKSYTQIYKAGMGFSAHVCGKVAVDGQTANVFFTNDSGNTVWLRLRILDEQDNLLAETGILRPNEYVQAVTFTRLPGKGAKIKLKIMAYEPDTYYSAGAVTLYTTAE